MKLYPGLNVLNIKHLNILQEIKKLTLKTDAM